MDKCVPVNGQGKMILDKLSFTCLRYCADVWKGDSVVSTMFQMFDITFIGEGEVSI